MELTLLVIRTGDMKALVEFYSILGLEFSWHKHGQSPYHYSASIGKTILEIYPLTKTQSAPDNNLRLGLAIDNFDNVVQQLLSINTTFVSQPQQTEWGYMTIIQDPDGRKIELYKK